MTHGTNWWLGWWRSQLQGTARPRRHGKQRRRTPLLASILCVVATPGIASPPAALASVVYACMRLCEARQGCDQTPFKALRSSVIARTHAAQDGPMVTMHPQLLRFLYAVLCECECARVWQGKVAGPAGGWMASYTASDEYEFRGTKKGTWIS